MNTALAEYGAAVMSRWRWLMWGALLSLAIATAFLVLKPPLYRSEATVFVRTPGDVSQVQDGGAAYAQGRAETYAALVNSTSVSSRVVADLGLDLTPEQLSKRIQAAHPYGTAVIAVSVSAPSADEAQRTASVLLDEYATTVRSLESVPGSVVPRADLVVVDPPGRPVRVVAGGVPVTVLLLGASLIGLFIGLVAVVLRSIVERPVQDQAEASSVATAPASAVIDPTATERLHGRHRSSRRLLARSRTRLSSTNEGDT